MIYLSVLSSVLIAWTRMSLSKVVFFFKISIDLRIYYCIWICRNLGGGVTRGRDRFKWFGLLQVERFYQILHSNGKAVLFDGEESGWQRIRRSCQRCHYLFQQQSGKCFISIVPSIATKLRHLYCQSEGISEADQWLPFVDGLDLEVKILVCDQCSVDDNSPLYSKVKGISSEYFVYLVFKISVDRTAFDTSSKVVHWARVRAGGTEPVRGAWSRGWLPRNARTGSDCWGSSRPLVAEPGHEM